MLKTDVKKDWINGKHVWIEEYNEYYDGKLKKNHGFFIIDFKLHCYREWIDRYKKGFITMETLDAIVLGDDLGQYSKPEDFIREHEECTKEHIDANLDKATKFENEWKEVMDMREINPQAWAGMIKSKYGEIIKRL